MTRRGVRFFTTLCGILIITAALHWAGTLFFLYWKILSFDIVVHTLGGLWIGGMALWLYYLSGFVRPRVWRRRWVYGIAVVWAFIIGIGWEVFEVVVGSVEADGSVYIIDTALDLIADGVGAMIVAAYFISQGYLQG